MINSTKMSTNWNTAQKKSYPHHKKNFNQNNNKKREYDPNFKSKSTIIRDQIVEIISSQTNKGCQDWPKINELLLHKINKSCDNDDKSLIMNNIMKLSLHEIIDNEEILKLVDTLHKNGKHAFIHFALWPIKDVNNLCQGFERSQDDIFRTIQILIEKSKFNILEQNEKQETVVKSLYEAEKCGYITKDNSTKIYNYFMEPNDKSSLKMTREIFNKLTESNFKNLSSTLCWLLSLKSCKLDIELFEKFKLVKTFDRDAKTGKYRELVKISKFLYELGSNGPITNGSTRDDFDAYFKLNPWNKNIISDICLNISHHFINSNPEDMYNKEIWGGAIGEFGSYDEILKFCNGINLDIYPEAVMTCIAHGYPRFKQIELINILKYIVENKKAKVKYNSEMVIQNFDLPLLEGGSQIFQTCLSRNKVVTQIPIVIESCSKNDDGELEILIEKINISMLNDITEIPKLDNHNIYPEELDDIAYSITKDYIGKYNINILIEALITKFVSGINKPNGIKSIGVLLEYLFTGNHIDRKKFYDIYYEKISEIKELWEEENPISINKVCKTIELKIKI